MDPNIKIKTEIEELEYDAAGNEYVLMDRALVKEEYAVVKEEPSGSDHDLSHRGSSDETVKFVINEIAETSAGPPKLSRIRHTPEYQCKNCTKIFTRQKALDDHISADHGKDIFGSAKRQLDLLTAKNLCKLCNKIYPTRKDLNEHISVVHGQSEIFNVAQRQLDSLNRIPFSRPVHVTCKRKYATVVSTFCENRQKNPKLNVSSAVRATSKTTGTPESTIWKILRKEKQDTSRTAPLKKSPHYIDHSTKSAIRRKINGMFLEGKLPNYENSLEAVWSDALLPDLTKSRLQKILQDMNFITVRQHGRNCLREKKDIIKCRKKYLDAIRKYRDEGRYTYYLNDTIVTMNYFGNLRNYYIIHIGGADGFLPGAFLWFETKKKMGERMPRFVSMDYFKKIQPLLKDNSVLILNDQFPTIVTGNNKALIYLPPQHKELNVVEYAWPMVAEYVQKNAQKAVRTDNVQPLLEEALNSITKTEWCDFNQLVIEEENMCSRIDEAADTLIYKPDPWKPDESIPEDSD